MNTKKLAATCLPRLMATMAEVFSMLLQEKTSWSVCYRKPLGCVCPDGDALPSALFEPRMSSPCACASPCQPSLPHLLCSLSCTGTHCFQHY